MRAWLAPSEPRCRPSQPCHRSGTCGRASAALPTAGAIVQDYSITKGAFGWCSGYVPVSACVPPVPEGVSVKPWPGESPE